MQTDNYKTQRKVGEKKIKKWTVIWLVSFFIARFAGEWMPEIATWLSISLVTITSGLGIKMILTLIQAMRGWDDLDKLVYYKASTVTFGFSLISLNIYELIRTVFFPDAAANIAHIVVMLCVTFMLAMINEKRKYQ